MDKMKINRNADLLDVHEVGEYLGIHARTVWRMRNDGTICKPITICKNIIRWRRSDLEKWLKGLQQWPPVFYFKAWLKAVSWYINEDGKPQWAVDLLKKTKAEIVIAKAENS